MKVSFAENKDLVFVKVLSACEVFFAENKDLVFVREQRFCSL